MGCRTWLVLAAVVAGCPEGRDKILADIQSSRPEVRALGIKRLAERGDADDVVVFSQATRDPIGIVRAEAMAALGASQVPEVVDLISEGLADTDELVQQRAATALASFKTDKARSALSLAYSRRGRTTRMAIVEALKGTNLPGAMASVVAAEANNVWERNLRILNEGSLPERVGAAEDLGRSGRADAVNKLVPLLQAKDVALAAAAARGLGLAGDARAVPALVALLDENFPELREAACDALGRLGDPAAVPRLLALALEGSPTSPFATRALLSLRRSPESDGALCELARSGAEAQALGAGRELRRRGGCPSAPIADLLATPATAQRGLLALAALAPRDGGWGAAVVPLSESSDPATRLRALEVLAELAEPAAAAALEKAWDSEARLVGPRRQDWVSGALPAAYAHGFDPSAVPSPEDAWAATRTRTADLFARVRALDAQRAREKGKALVEPSPPREVVEDASDEELRRLAVLLRAQGRLKLDGARGRLLAHVDDPSPALRAAAWAGLAALGEDARPALFDPDPAVRSATALALVEAGPAGQLVVLGALPGLSGDRSALLEPLKAVTPPVEGAAHLITLLAEGGLEAGVAARLLGEMGARTAAPAVAAMLDDPQAIARTDALLALGRLGDAGAAPLIAKDLFSDSVEVRAAAAQSLATLKVPTHLDALDALTGDYDRRVRESARAALDALAPRGGAGREGKP